MLGVHLRAGVVLRGRGPLDQRGGWPRGPRRAMTKGENWVAQTPSQGPASQGRNDFYQEHYLSPLYHHKTIFLYFKSLAA